jgi:O-antigen ligase
MATVTGQAAYAAAQAAAAQDSTDYVATAFRVTGPFTIWHSLGGYLLFPIVLGILVLLRGRRTLLPMPVVVAVLALDLSALVLSVTVTLLLWLPVAALVAAALAGVFKRAVTGLVVIGVVAGLVFSSALTSRLQQETTASASTAAAAGDGSGTSLLDVQTLQYRFLVWERDYLPVVGRAAAIGLGTDTPPSAIFTSTENQYLTYLLRGGIVQVIVSLVALGALFVRALRYARQPRAPGRMAAQALCGILVFMPLGMMVWPYLSNAGLSYVLFSVGGAVLSVDGRRRPQAAEAPQPERALQPVRG